MKRALLLLGALLVAAALPCHGAVSLPEAWAAVQGALESGDADGLEQAVRDLRATGDEAGAKRLTPYAKALVQWARAHPGEKGERAVLLAARLDPDLPSVHFLAAAASWEKRAPLAAARRFAGGWLALLRDWNSRRLLVRSLWPWFLAALAGAVVVGVLFQTIRFLPELVHDAWELGQVLFRKADAAVFAVVVVALPVFAGLGLLWLAAWLFVLTWAYLDSRGRILAGLLWVMGFLVVPASQVWMDVGLRAAPIPDRVEAMLREERADLSTLQGFADLEEQLGESAAYHLILGRIFLLHGDLLDARLHFQKARLADDSDPRAQVFLGNIAFAEGNIPEAIQLYSGAIERDPRCVLAYYNLSYAFDRTYRFQEADAMRTKARELAGREYRRLRERGGELKIVDPVVDGDDVDRLALEVSPEQWRAAGLAARGLPDPGEIVLRPAPMMFLVTGVLGLVGLVLRKRWMWTGRACSRCGNVFCPRCKTARESDAYCSQCISVFLKRDMVAIEQQSAKLDQIRRWERWTDLGRRALAVLVPGSGSILLGRWITGIAEAFLVVFCVAGAFLWLPGFLASVEPAVTALPVQAALLVFAALVWIRSIVTSWARR